VKKGETLHDERNPLFLINKSLLKAHDSSLTAANWVSFDFNVAYSSR